jgi:copper homeostasis protein CutC
MVELLVDAGRDRANIGVVDDKFIKKVNKWAGKIKAGEEMAFDAYEDLETYLKGIPHYDPTHLILVGEEEEESEPERA